MDQLRLSEKSRAGFSDREFETMYNLSGSVESF